MILQLVPLFGCFFFLDLIGENSLHRKTSLLLLDVNLFSVAVSMFLLFGGGCKSIDQQIPGDLRGVCPFWGDNLLYITCERGLK